MKFSDIEEAFFFASSGYYGENVAILCPSTGEIYYHSACGDIDDELPDEEFDPAIHVKLPHKNDLNVGRNLVFEFVEEHLPEECGTVQRFFRHRGAYARYKSLLDTYGLLQTWYDFENVKVHHALRTWCQEMHIEVTE